MTSTLKNMGGAQLYLSSKLCWLKKNGWDVDVIYFDSTPSVIPVLREYTHCVKELQYMPYYYSSKKTKKILAFLETLIRPCSLQKVIIESTGKSIALWGELLAKKIEAKHILFNLQEVDVVTNQSMIDFLLFKHKRKELIGIQETSLSKLFNSIKHPIKPSESYSLRAYMTNPVEDFDHPLIDVIKKENYDYVVGSISRLDKQFVVPAFDEFSEYVNLNKNKRFALILIGDAPDSNNNRKYIEDTSRNINNLDVFITGYLYPIPKRLLLKCNMFYASAGSARVSSELGIPTIVYDACDSKTIGILGYTTDNSLFRKDEPALPLSYYLDEILKFGKYPKIQAKERELPDYSKHLDFIKCTIQTKEYFTKFKWNDNQKKQSLIIPLLGPQLFFKIFK